MKETIFKSVTALLCVIAICITSSVSIGKYTEAMKEAAKYAPAASAGVSGDNADADQPDANTDGDANPDGNADADVPADGTTDAAPDDATQAPDNSSSNNSSSSDKTNSNAAKDPTKFSKAEIVAYYNKAIKDAAKAPKLTAVRTEVISIVVDSMKPNSNTLKNIINDNVLSKYAKPTTYTENYKNGVNADGGKAVDFLPKSNLEAAGAKSAKITKSGSNYLITIVTVAEKTTLEKPQAKYVSQCASPLDLASIDLGPIKIVQADMNYPGVTLKATVDANGKLLHSNFDQPLNGTGTASVIGLKPSATVHGGLTQEVKYTY